jgi:hypothetical protein
MARIKGSPKTGGRKKGTPNKIDSNLKDQILKSLIIVGGVDYLAKQAELNPGPYLSLLGKCLPRDLNNNVSLNKTDLLQEIVSALPK